MLQIFGEIWDYHKRGHWIAITTNGDVKKTGECVMGRGIALQAKRRFPRLPLDLGQKIISEGNHVHLFPEYRIVSFPVKYHWFESADLQLIERSAKELTRIWDAMSEPVYIVRPGCGNGGLTWMTVKPIIETIFSDSVVVVEKGRKS